MVERLIVSEPIIARREDFGPGKAGEIAYAIINSGNPCEVKVESKPCSKKAIETVDFDIPILSGVEFIPVCSAEHRNKAQEDMDKFNKEVGNRVTSFGTNGFGRA